MGVCFESYLTVVHSVDLNGEKQWQRQVEICEQVLFGFEESKIGSRELYSWKICLTSHDLPIDKTSNNFIVARTATES